MSRTFIINNFIFTLIKLNVHLSVSGGWVGGRAAAGVANSQPFWVLCDSPTLLLLPFKSLGQLRTYLREFIFLLAVKPSSERSKLCCNRLNIRLQPTLESVNQPSSPEQHCRPLWNSCDLAGQNGVCRTRLDTGNIQSVGSLAACSQTDCIVGPATAAPSTQQEQLYSTPSISPPLHITVNLVNQFFCSRQQVINIPELFFLTSFAFLSPRSVTFKMYNLPASQSFS